MSCGAQARDISRSYGLILRAAFRNGFSDPQCGFKAGRAEIVHDLSPLIEDNGWFFDSELLVPARLARGDDHLGADAPRQRVVSVWWGRRNRP